MISTIGSSQHEEDPLLTPEEIRQVLRFKEGTLAGVYALLRRGEIRGFKVSERWRARRSAVEEYLRGREGR